MRTEIRKVTVEQEVYIANDGREFTDEDECTDYEFNLVEKTLTYYDIECQKTDDVHKCMIINLITDSDVENFKLVCDVCDIPVEGIGGPGLYIYNEYKYEGGWLDVDEIISKIRGGSE